MYISLEEAKKHLNIDPSFTDDDDYILKLIDVAEDAVEKNTDIALADQVEGGELAPSTYQAILLLIGNFYANREPVSYSTISEIPYAFKYLVNLNRNFRVG